MLKRFLPWAIFSTGCCWGLANWVANPMVGAVALAQAEVSPAAEDLYYTFYNQRIALIERRDQIAVEFKPTPNFTRGGAEPAYLRLQRDLNATLQNTRGDGGQTSPTVEVRPLGSRYALVDLPAPSRGVEDQLLQRLQQSYIQSTLPVLSRPGGQDSIVVTPEIVVSVEPGTTSGQVQSLLRRYDLELIRPLRFSQHRYLVRARYASGTAILSIANQLATIPGIQSATPNFVQSVDYQVMPLGLLTQTGRGEAGDDQSPQVAAAIPNSPFANSLLPRQWHLHSRGVGNRLLPRTDINALAAWQHSNRGQDSVVAVIDSLIQWDHPDLVENLYRLPTDATDRLPGEVHGWDFSNTAETCDPADTGNCALGDPDTRISAEELDALRPHLHHTLTLSDGDLLAAYPRLDAALVEDNPELTESQRARMTRDWIQKAIASEFHGTWSAGVIAANPQDRPGVVGVAPAAKVLPVRVFGLGGEITGAALIEAMGYAAARHADVINLSLGSLLPDQELTAQIFTLLDQHPDLVIIAAAGNESLDGVDFPAAVPGVIAVGATNISGNRASYSSFGAGLDLVAPGGEITLQSGAGILTTGGTWIKDLWTGLTPPDRPWGFNLDSLGQYVQVEGTSFSAPMVAGVMALLKGQDPEGRLDRQQLTQILATTAHYYPLRLTQADTNHYRLQASLGFGTVLDFPFVRPSGITGRIEPISPEQYFFGQGLVDAAAAVEAVNQSLAQP